MLKHFLADNQTNPIFIRNSLRRYTYLALLLLLINCALVAYLYFLIFTAQTPEYFATTSDGRIINIYPEK